MAVGADLYKLQPGDVAAKTDAPAPPKAEAPKAEPAKKEAPAKPAPAAAPEKPAAPAKAAPTQSSTSSSSAPAKPAAASGARGERRVKMKKIRIRIADRLKDSQNTYAMLTTFNEVDMSALIALRNKYKDLFEKEHGVKLGFMSPFLKAAATALQTIPAVNAVIDGPEIVYRDYVDISVAVASPAGLVVPVIRNVETLSLADIERSIGDAAAKARDGTLSMEEMAGGTFTVSNGGVFGSLVRAPHRGLCVARSARRRAQMGTPIINPPQSAILGSGARRSHGSRPLIAPLCLQHARHQSATGGDRWQSGDSTHDVHCSDVRSSPDRRTRGRHVFGASEARDRRPRPNVVGRLIGQ